MVNRISEISNKLKKDEAILLYQPDAPTRNHDVKYPFSPDRSIFYISGICEPDTWLLILPHKSIVFSHPCLAKNRLWEGERLADKCIQNHKITNWHPIDTFDQKIASYLNTTKTLYTNTESFDISIETQPVEKLIATLRICKDPSEIAAIRQAASISANAHNFLMEHAQLCRNEMELEGAFYQYICQQKTNNLAYPSIIASGKNACILHYHQNNSALKKEQLILVDAGCAVNQYASDITRTFPYKSKFNSEQQALYEAVLDTQIYCISLLRPNVLWSDIHQAACKRITEHLIELKYLTGSIQQAMEQKAYQEYFPHGIGHSIGLDVHDVPFKTLKENMVVTIEPGLYIPDAGIGIRIEDNILITKQGSENLSHEALKTIKDINQLCHS